MKRKVLIHAIHAMAITGVHYDSLTVAIYQASCYTSRKEDCEELIREIKKEDAKLEKGSSQYNDRRERRVAILLNLWKESFFGESVIVAMNEVMNETLGRVAQGHDDKSTPSSQQAYESIILEYNRFNERVVSRYFHKFPQ